MRVHVNQQGRVMPCRAKHRCRFGTSFEEGATPQINDVLARY